MKLKQQNDREERKERAEEQVAAKRRLANATYSLGGNSEYNKGNYRAAADHFLLGIKHGDPACQVGIGKMHYYGKGFPINKQEAHKWFSYAAKRGNASGQYYLGLLYQNGEFEHQDFNTAMNWFQKSANQGNPQAQYQLAKYYQEGIATSQDFVKAYAWAHIAAESGASYDLVRQLASDMTQNSIFLAHRQILQLQKDNPKL